MGYKIGITEAGDAGIDLSWIDKLDTVDGAILITKKITQPMIDAIKDRNNIVVHATITGYGGTVLEPNVPSTMDEFNNTIRLIKAGFSAENIVIRVDPIISSLDGVSLAEKVIKRGIELGFWRYRVSIIDMYPHVRERFKKAKISLPYGDGFSPSVGHIARVDKMLSKLWKENPNINIESCAENLRAAKPRGCISDWDLVFMGLDISNEVIDTRGFQRKGCLCYSGKTELLTHKCQCPNKCVYCYWK